MAIFRNREKYWRGMKNLNAEQPKAMPPYDDRLPDQELPWADEVKIGEQELKRDRKSVHGKHPQ